MGGAGGLIAQVLVEAGSTVAGEDRGACVVFLRGEQVAGAGEVGQVAQAHDPGWLAIRGISDHADADKDDAFHQVASWHAAATLIGLLPYLKHR